MKKGKARSTSQSLVKSGLWERLWWPRLREGLCHSGVRSFKSNNKSILFIWLSFKRTVILKGQTQRNGRNLVHELQTTYSMCSSIVRWEWLSCWQQHQVAKADATRNHASGQVVPLRRYCLVPLPWQMDQASKCWLCCSWTCDGLTGLWRHWTQNHPSEHAMNASSKRQAQQSASCSLSTSEVVRLWPILPLDKFWKISGVSRMWQSTLEAEVRFPMASDGRLGHWAICPS